MTSLSSYLLHLADFGPIINDYKQMILFIKKNNLKDLIVTIMNKRIEIDHEGKKEFQVLVKHIFNSFYCMDETNTTKYSIIKPLDRNYMIFMEGKLNFINTLQVKEDKSIVHFENKLWNQHTSSNLWFLFR
jgi:hypothetical protein